MLSNGSGDDTAGTIIGWQHVLIMLAVVMRKCIVETNSIASVGNHGVLTISWIGRVWIWLVGDELTRRVSGRRVGVAEVAA